MRTVTAGEDSGREQAPPEKCLEAARRLMRFLEADVIPVLGELSLSETDRLLLTFLMRAMTTFEAMIELAEHGFGEQAAMLDRSLFEQMLDTHWVADNADEAKELLRDHEMLTRGEFVAASKRHPEFFPLPVDGVGIPGDEELDALRRRFSKGGMSWTGLRFQERLAAVKAKWPPETRDSLAYFADVPYKINNLWLHPSPFAMHSAVEHEGDTLHLRYGPSGNYVEPALFSGVWGIGQIVTLILQRCEPASLTSERFEKKMWGPNVASFVVLSPEITRGVGRNDLCPCESGLKFKHCHGA